MVFPLLVILGVWHSMMDLTRVHHSLAHTAPVHRDWSSHHTTVCTLYATGPAVTVMDTQLMVLMQHIYLMVRENSYVIYFRQTQHIQHSAWKNRIADKYRIAEKYRVAEKYRIAEKKTASHISFTHTVIYFLDIKWTFLLLIMCLVYAFFFF